jgi:hypothetical protein
MGAVLTLLEAVRDLASFDGASVICAAEPFTENSATMIIPEQESGRLPEEVERRGFKYFLEVFIARDFLEDWVTDLNVAPTLVEKCARLIQYAKNDS